MSVLTSKASSTRDLYRSASPAILPSLLMCDFSNLEREVRKLEEAGTKVLHLDVMDGVFVPNLTYGMPIVSSLRKITDLALDVHLMITEPAKYADQFVDAGADSITFHIEAHSAPEDLLVRIREQGVLSGLAINPNTEFASAERYAELCDLFLVMSVPAGFGGQAFHPIALERLATLRDRFGDKLLLEVDGGVNDATIKSCAQAGADLLVVGSALFKHNDYCQAVARLQAAMS